MSLFIVEGLPASGKSFVGRQIAERLRGRVQVFDADDFTQELLTKGSFESCAAFRRDFVRRARAALVNAIRRVPASKEVVIVGIVTMLWEAKPWCAHQLLGCRGCPPIGGRAVHRLWLDAAPRRGSELHECVKRAVVRELRRPRSEWLPDDESGDPWDAMQPPSRRVSASAATSLMAMPIAAFRAQYPDYFRAMLASFKSDGVHAARERALARGFRAMRADAIVAQVVAAADRRPTSSPRRERRRERRSPRLAAGARARRRGSPPPGKTRPSGAPRAAGGARARRAA